MREQSDRQLEIESQHLNLKQINRSDVAVRVGPSPRFAPIEKEFAYGEAVVVLIKQGFWRKVSGVEREINGWVHFRRLSPLERPLKKVEMSLRNIPMVFATRNVSKVFRMTDKSIFTTYIPKGRGFPLVNSNDGRYLIWIAETRDLAWVDSKYIQ